MPREPREYVATPRKRPAEITLDPSPARIVTPPTRVLAPVHTWTLDMAPLDPNDADWRAVYAPRVEINLWQLQPAYRDMLVQRMFEGLLMPMTMLTDAHNGPAAAGTLTGLRIVPPREFQFPLMPRAPDLAAAAEIMELWSRPATRLILPRFLLHGTLLRLACAPLHASRVCTYSPRCLPQRCCHRFCPEEFLTGLAVSSRARRSTVSTRVRAACGSPPVACCGMGRCAAPYPTAEA